MKHSQYLKMTALIFICFYSIESKKLNPKQQDLVKCLCHQRDKGINKLQVDFNVDKSSNYVLDEVYNLINHYNTVVRETNARFPLIPNNQNIIQYRELPNKSAYEVQSLPYDNFFILIYKNISQQGYNQSLEFTIRPRQNDLLNI